MVGAMREPELDDDSSHLPDWKLPLAFSNARHASEPCESIPTQTWRMKERMKTVSVALVMCLNIGVDPPDVVKTQPCARLECWLDPLQSPPQKALESIGAALQKQYERWQSRARYKLSLDPTVEEVKKLCSSLRRNSKEDRVLFHYNGHGVPKPTINGEIWVFNRTYTQYIPLSMYDLQQWMGAPSIYVYDCSSAGLILESFNKFAIQHEREFEISLGSVKGQAPPCYRSCIQLAACRQHQVLPMNPELPADLFTSCLTTPVQMALRWFVLQKASRLVPSVTLELLERVPGQLHDRRTMLGELNWIFTAITDTIAWNVLPKALFQRLFRQDLLVASLFRNFLLAERVMRAYDCQPVSQPALPPTFQHPMWQAWDLALDLCLAQLARVQQGHPFQHSPFFAQQLTAFQVWLTFGSEQSAPPEQLPIVLQVLLSQIHRVRALDLLGRFLDLGPWAVNLALSVGIFPYILKLLQSCARDLRPLLVSIWAKILAVDQSCQVDLVRDNGHRYFLSVLSDLSMPPEHRTMAAFVMSCIVANYPSGQEAALKGNVIALCTEQLTDSHPRLRQWLAICLGRTWNGYTAARWCGIRDSAHEKLSTLLADPVPEVRAAAVFALGTILNCPAKRTDHADTIDHNIGMTLISSVANDGSPMVRKELVVALQWLLFVFETQFVAVAYQYLEEETSKEAVHANNLGNLLSPASAEITPLGMKKVASRDRLKLLPITGNLLSGAAVVEGLPEPPPVLLAQQQQQQQAPVQEKMRRVSSSTSICSLGSILGSYGSVYSQVWRALVTLGNDPHPEVATMARLLLKAYRDKAQSSFEAKKCRKSSVCHSEPSSPSGKISYLSSESPPPTSMNLSLRPPVQTPTRSHQFQHTAHFSRSRKIFDRGPDVPAPVAEDDTEEHLNARSSSPLVTTGFVDWCSQYFTRPLNKILDVPQLGAGDSLTARESPWCQVVTQASDSESMEHQQREWRFLRNARIRLAAQAERRKTATGARLDEQVFYSRCPSVPTCLAFHPHEAELCVANRDSYSLWDDHGNLQSCHMNENPAQTRITALTYLNAHDVPLLLLGSDDGAVRVWRNYSLSNRELVAAFQALGDVPMTARGSGMVLDWDQETTTLITSGDVKVIRVWDTNQEKKVLDMPTGADYPITSLSIDHEGSLLVAGCGDGTIRVYDRRLPPADCRIMTLREHNSWIVNVHLNVRERRITSGCVTGDVRFWELGQSCSTHTVSTHVDMTAMAVHPVFDVFACGSASQQISVFNKEGDNMGSIRHHDWFINQRVGPVSCLAFHPYKMCLASGSTDSIIGVYTTDRKH
ncbi:regulatory-associated protein of mTOR isoform X2 [Dermacentor andersoni]|uniref:regulatory-associated protein of mTOR isoform X2 n=1 Tax=Dermacentor andersoni TaxID=34620 RepID=UPI002155C453|nr:regulatory-associated protein of mTOR-like isoform X2 [Dermacentor andersoni]